MSTVAAVIGKATKISIAKGIAKVEVTAQVSNIPTDILDWDGESVCIYKGDAYIPKTPIEEEADRKKYELDQNKKYEGMNPPPNGDSPTLVLAIPERPPEWCEENCTQLHVEQLNQKPYATCLSYDGNPVLNHDEEGHWLRCKDCFEECHPNVTNLESDDDEEFAEGKIDEDLFDRVCRSCVVAGGVRAHSYIEDFVGPCEKCGKVPAEGETVDYFRVRKPAEAITPAEEDTDACEGCEQRGWDETKAGAENDGYYCMAETCVKAANNISENCSQQEKTAENIPENIPSGSVLEPIKQEAGAPVHTDADEITEEEASILAENAKPERIFRVHNESTNEFWEGEAETPEAACLKVGWMLMLCSIKEKTYNGAGGWKTPEELKKRKATNPEVGASMAGSVFDSKPLCREYVPGNPCTHVRDCATDCCQKCPDKTCSLRCQPAKGLDEGSEG